MRQSRYRPAMIALLVTAAVLSVVGKKEDSPPIGWLAFLAFAFATFLYVLWRRDVAQQRRARVFDREAKTDETRTRTDE